MVLCKEKIGDVDLTDINMIVKLERMCGACATYCKEDKFNEAKNNFHHFSENVLRRVYYTQTIRFPGQLGKKTQLFLTYH